MISGTSAGAALQADRLDEPWIWPGQSPPLASRCSVKCLPCRLSISAEIAGNSTPTAVRLKRRGLPAGKFWSIAVVLPNVFLLFFLEFLDYKGEKTECSRGNPALSIAVCLADISAHEYVRIQDDRDFLKNRGHPSRYYEIFFCRGHPGRAAALTVHK